LLYSPTLIIHAGVLMKKLITTLILGIMLSTQVSANCLDQYENEITDAYVKGALTTTGAAATAYVGILSTSIGLSLVQSGEVIQGILTTIASEGPAAGLSSSSVRQIINIVSYSRVRNLIEESEVVFGDLLTEVAEELTEDLGKTITVEDVSNLIIAANESKLFCDETRLEVFNFVEVYNYLAKELK